MQVCKRSCRRASSKIVLCIHIQISLGPEEGPLAEVLHNIFIEIELCISNLLGS